jgi:hypothetical protein
MSETYRPPQSIAQMFGSSDHDKVFNQPPGSRRSAELHASRAARVRAEAVAARQLAHLDAIASEREEDEALERALDLRSRGGEPGAKTLALAMRALARQDTGPRPSSAEEMAAGYLNRDDPAEDFDYTV